MAKVITRKEAIEKGLKRYFTGKPCKRGHTVERYMSGGSCKECHHIKGTSEEKKAYDKAYRAALKVTPLGYAKLMFKKIQSRCLPSCWKDHPTYQDIRLLFNFKEFRELLYQPKWRYEEMHEIYKRRGYQQNLAPSVNRLDPDLNYSLDNIEILPFGEHIRKDKLKLSAKRNKELLS